MTGLVAVCYPHCAMNRREGDKKSVGEGNSKGDGDEGAMPAAKRARVVGAPASCWAQYPL